MPLSTDDMKYLDGKFNNMYGTIGKLDEKVDSAKLETCTRLTKLETEYKEHAKKEVKNATNKYKFSTIGIAAFSVFLGFIQLLP